MTHNHLRIQLQNYIGIAPQNASTVYTVIEAIEKSTYTQCLISYEGSEGDLIPAYLLIPKGLGPYPGLLIHHQHNRERHLGKSEVCGLAGNPLQAFGLELVQRGFIVLAPDSICFEDRRKNAKGIMSDGENDFWQHYDEMCYRILGGSSLMKKVIDDANIGFNLLKNHESVDQTHIGVLGHSYGGNTVIFQAATNEDIRFACSSGAACTYRNKMTSGTGIEMAEVIPGFIERFEITDLVTCIAPRPFLMVSAIDDKYSKDADHIEQQVRPVFEAQDSSNHFKHVRYSGGHSLTPERVEAIVNWLVGVVDTSKE